MKKLASFFLLIMMGGCSVTTTVPPLHEYRLSPTIQPLSLDTNTQCKAQTLKVSQIFALDTLQTKKMRYALQSYEEYAYTQSRWVVAPSEAIIHNVIESLQQDGMFKSVIEYGSKAQANLLLELRVDEFMQYFDADEKSSFVKVTLGMRLIDQNNNEVVIEKSFHEVQKAQSADAQGGVAALNTAVAKVIQEVRSTLAEVCRDK